MRTPHQLALAWLQGALRHLNRNVDTDAYFRASDEEHDLMMSDDGHWVPRPDDSRLLLAAPDLLDAAKKSAQGPCDFDGLNPCWDGRPTDQIGKHWGGGPACSVCHARAAITKAEGTS